MQKEANKQTKTKAFVIWGDLPNRACPLQPWAIRMVRAKKKPGLVISSQKGDGCLHPSPLILRAVSPPHPRTSHPLLSRKSPSRLPCGSDSWDSALSPISDFLPSLKRGYRIKPGQHCGLRAGSVHPATRQCLQGLWELGEPLLSPSTTAQVFLRQEAS